MPIEILTFQTDVSKECAPTSVVSKDIRNRATSLVMFEPINRMNATLILGSPS